MGTNTTRETIIGFKIRRNGAGGEWLRAHGGVKNRERATSSNESSSCSIDGRCSARLEGTALRAYQNMW